MPQTPTLTVADVLDALNRIAPPHLSLGDDPRGLLIGDPAAPVRRVRVALDVTRPLAQLADEETLLVAHHPLIFHPLKTVQPVEQYPGAVVWECVRRGASVACAHTDWDVAPGGVNDVLVNLLGATEEVRPLQITYREPLVKIAVFVPTKNREAVLDAMTAAGAGALSNSLYDRCAFWTPGMGTFRPLPGANPHIGSVGAPEVVAEDRLEMIVSKEKTAAVVRAMKGAHPYEEVAYDVYPLANTAGEWGIGRVGRLPKAIDSEAFLQSVRAALAFDAVRFPPIAPRTIRTVAVCGGAGASLVPDAVKAGADVLVTSDVRHHEFMDAEARNFLLVDAGHAATETPGTKELARRLRDALPKTGLEVTFHAPNGAEA